MWDDGVTSLFEPSVMRNFRNLEKLSLVGKNSAGISKRVETFSKTKTIVAFITAFQKGGFYRLQQLTIYGG